MTVRLLPIVLVVASLGCGAEAPSADPSPRPAQPGPIGASDIQAAMQETVAALNAGDATRASATYATDAVFVNARGKFETQSGIQDFWAQALKSRGAGSAVNLELLKWGASGDMAYSFGRFTSGITAGSGHVLAVHQRQSDGSLKTVAQISIPDPASK